MATDRAILKRAQIGMAASMGMSNPVTAVQEAHEETFIFDLDADASQAERGITCVKPYKVKRVDITPSSSLAAHATAYVTYVGQKRPVGDLSTPATVFSFDTATGGSNVSLTAWTQYSATLTAANTIFAAGDVLTFKATESSTPTSPLGQCAITVEYIG